MLFWRNAFEMSSNFEVARQVANVETQQNRVIHGRLLVANSRIDLQVNQLTAGRFAERAFPLSNHNRLTWSIINFFAFGGRWPVR